MRARRSKENGQLSGGDNVSTPYDDNLREYYKSQRDDIRCHCTLLFQVLTLLLTTITIVSGWGLKEFLESKYDAAMATSSPTLYAIVKRDRGSPTEGSPPTLTEAQLNEGMRRAGDTFRSLLWTSPTVSFFLCSTLFFLSVLVGMLIAMAYILQRRRRGAHLVEKQMGIKSDVPIFDPVLTIGSLKLLQYVTGAFTVLCLVAAISQISLGVLRDQFVRVHWLPMSKQLSLSVIVSEIAQTDWQMLIILVVVFSLAFLKFCCTFSLFWNFRAYDRDASWDERWMNTHDLVTSLIRKTKRRDYNLPQEAIQALLHLRSACVEVRKDKTNRTKIWKTKAVPAVKSLASSLNLAKLRDWPGLKLTVLEITENMRIKRVGRHLR